MVPQTSENTKLLAYRKSQIKKKSADGSGYEREVGAKGAKLSGGQKQRIAIARTVIRKPKIFLFDEATSALDTESEKVVQNALNRVSEDSTTLTIAHRIASIKDSHHIFYLKNGKVAEQGSFHQLIDLKGEFYSVSLN